MGLYKFGECYNCVHLGDRSTGSPCINCNGSPSDWGCPFYTPKQYGMDQEGMGGNRNTVTINYQLQINPAPLEVKNVIFNYPATIVFWSDGTKTVVKCAKQDEYDIEKGLAMAICKKLLGDSEFKHTFKRYRNKVDQADTGLSYFNNWLQNLEPAMQKLVESLKPVKEVKKNET